MSTPTRPRVLPSAQKGTPRRTNGGGNSSSLPQTPRGQTTSIRDQIRALRQAAKTPAAGALTPGGRERREAVRELVRRAAETGRLVIPAHLDGAAADAGPPPLTHLPIALYTLLLGIPPSELSRKPPRPSSAPKTPSSPFPGSRARPAAAGLDNALSALDLGASDSTTQAAKDAAFGEEMEAEAVGGFIGGRDLEVLKVGGQALEELDLELGLFGGLRALDVRDNKLAKLPSSLPHLGLLTTLNLSHNSFTEFPTLLALLPSLTSLDLSSNALSTLSFTLPARTPMFPPSFSSPPPSPDAPTTPFPALRTLVLEANRLELDHLPTEGWPAALDALHLGRNNLFSPRGAGSREVNLAECFLGSDELRYLGLEETGIASLTLSGRASKPALQVVNLSANAGLIVDRLAEGWDAHSSGARLSVKESGEAHPNAVELVVDAHLIPGAGDVKVKRHVYVPPSPPQTAPSSEARPDATAPPALADEEDDPFWSSRARDAAASARRQPGTATATAAVATEEQPSTRSTRANGSAKSLAGFDDWDPMPSPASSSTSRPSAAASSSGPSCPTPSTAVASPTVPLFAADLDPTSVYATSYSAHSQTFLLAATTKTPIPSLPAGAFSVATLAAQPYASILRSVALSGRQIRSFVDVPPPPMDGAVFLAVEHLSVTQSPVHLSPLAPSLPTLFPNLRTLDLSESAVFDAVFADPAVVRALLVDVGICVIRARESGVRSLKGLEVVAGEIRDGRRGNWRCEEIDVRDNLIEQLDPALGHLPLERLLVDRNLFRRPNRLVWEREGTQGLLAWLRDCP